MRNTLFKRMIENRPLGRWNITCDKVNTIKVQWANIDNCGTCSIHKNENKNTPSSKKIETTSYTDDDLFYYIL